MLSLIVGLLIGASAPDRVLPCSYISTQPYLSTAEKLRTADFIFTGYVLDAAPYADRFAADTITFVVENSWKGAHPDTLRVNIASPCPQLASRGVSYIVAARWNGTMLVATRETGILAHFGAGYDHNHARADSIQAFLGAAAWTAPAMSERRLEAASALLDAEGGVRLTISPSGPYRGGAGMRMSLLGTALTDLQPSNGFFTFRGLRAGMIYRLRVHYADGQRAEDYFVRASCVEDTYGCSDFLSLYLGAKAERMQALPDSAALRDGIQEAVAAVTTTSMAVKEAKRWVVDLNSMSSALLAVGGGRVAASSMGGSLQSIRADATDVEDFEGAVCVREATCPYGSNAVAISVGGATYDGSLLTVSVALQRLPSAGARQISWRVRLKRSAVGWDVERIAIWNGVN